MADVICAKCGEPWEAWGLRNIGKDWCETEEEAKDFRSGKGCPSCKWGDEIPAQVGQTYKATSGIFSSIGVNNGDKATVEWILNEKWMEGMDYKGDAVKGDPFKVYYVIKPIAAKEFAVPKSMFHRHFKLVPTQEEIEQAENLKLKAAQSDCAASDEDPIKILQERGIY